MAKVTVGNTHIGTNYLTSQYIMQGRTFIKADIEVIEADGMLVYEYRPPHDQKEDGKYEIEFYYYYRKPTSDIFYSNFNRPSDFYIVPIISQVDDDFSPMGTLCWDAEKISLVGRESGWIHVTLHADEQIWGSCIYNGKYIENPLYIGIYSPILTACWDTTGPENIKPYRLYFDLEEAFGDNDYCEHYFGGDMYEGWMYRRENNGYPSIYITYQDDQIDSFDYKVELQGAVKPVSKLSHKSKFVRALKKQLLIKEIMSRITTLKRSASEELVINELKKTVHGIVFGIIEELEIEDSNKRSLLLKRLMNEAAKVTDLIKRELRMYVSFENGITFDSRLIRDLLISRVIGETITSEDINKKLIDYKRKLETVPGINSTVERWGKSFRSTEDEIPITAVSFASRLFFRTVETVLSLWDWLRGKIRETNNIVSFYCPIDLEIEIEARI